MKMQKLKMIIDVLLTIALLLLMPYGMVGEAAHEWIGAAMFVLFVIHPFQYPRLHGKRNRHLPACICIHKDSGNQRPSENGSHDLRLLGFCPDVPSSGTSLACHTRRSRKNASKARDGQAEKHEDMDRQAFGRCHRCIWTLCIYRERLTELYADAGAFCVFRLFGAGASFYSRLYCGHGNVHFSRPLSWKRYPKDWKKMTRSTFSVGLCRMTNGKFRTPAVSDR